MEKLALRKEFELNLIQEYDHLTMEYWYVMDKQWLEEWKKFIRDPETFLPPPRISTSTFFNQFGELIEGLKIKKDYRVVNPLVYHILLELYGKDESIELPRLDQSIYSPIPDFSNLQLGERNYYCQLESKVLVQQIRSKWLIPNDPVQFNERPQFGSCFCFNEES